jgi:aminoglycoside phosphotransferase (APT) family kinase protein
VHAVDWAGVALGDLGHPERFLERQVDRWLSQLASYRGRELPPAHDVAAWLEAHRPPEQAPTLFHGDYKLDNVLFATDAPPRLLAVVDWEMASIGDPLLDLGWWIFADETLTLGSGFERLPGFESRAETAQRWAKRTGRGTDALDWFLVFAGLRFTVIMVRMGKLLAETGLVPPGFAYDNLVSQGLERHLARV